MRARVPRVHPLSGAIAAALLASATGCTVGPDFKSPEPLPVTQYTATNTNPSPPDISGQTQILRSELDLPAEWWKVFQSSTLDALVRQALAESPTMAKAQARLREATEQLSAATGGTRYPTVDAQLSANRVDVDPKSFNGGQLPIGFPLNLYFASVNVSYALDLFGAQRRELEAMRSAVDFQRFEYEAARLTLAGNVVTCAIREASLRERIDRIKELIDLQAKQVDITKQRVQAGAVAEVELLAQQSSLAQSRAQLPELQLQLDQARHRLAIYLGQPPGAVPLPTFVLSDLKLPNELPLSVPSELARQRPDIQAAEALLHQASARVGVATANRYPRITLTATGGALATNPDVSAPFYLLSAGILQPLFHGGELNAKKRAAVAAYEQAAAAYKEVVLKGFGEVADTLRALEADATRVHERTLAAEQARSVYEIMSKRFEVGGVSTLTVLDAQQRYERATADRVQAVADRYANTAALFQALGGGWWNRSAQTSAE